MKLLTGILFVAAVSLFTLFSKGFGQYGARLEADLMHRAAEHLHEAREATAGSVDLKASNYQLSILGMVASVEEKEAIRKLITGSMVTGRGQVRNGLEIGRVGPFVSGVHFEKTGLGKLDIAALERALGASVGGGFDEGTTRELAAKLEKLPEVRKVEFSVESVGDERRLTGSVLPTPPAVTDVEIVAVGKDRVEFDRDAVARRLGLRVGDDYDPGMLAMAELNIASRKEIVEAEVAGVEDGDGFKIVARVRAVKRTPMVVSALDFFPFGGAEIDEAAAQETAEVGVGDTFAPELLESMEAKLVGSGRYSEAKVTAEETEAGYHLTAKVTPKLRLPQISMVDIDLPDGVDFDRKEVAAVLKGAGIESGAEVKQSKLEGIEVELRQLDGVEDAEIALDREGGEVRVVAKIVPVKQVGPGPHPVAGIEFEVPDGEEFDVAAALAASGIQPGAKVEASDLRRIAKRLEGLQEVKSAAVEMKNVRGSVRLVAKMVLMKKVTPLEGPNSERAGGENSDNGRDVPQKDATPAAKNSQSESDSALSAALEDINIYFWTSSVVISRKDAKKLERAAAAIVESGNQTAVSVTGFADPRGDLESNRRLSLRRAKAVCEFLVERGVKPGILQLNGAGVPGSESLQEQRRVEVRRVE